MSLALGLSEADVPGYATSLGQNVVYDANVLGECGEYDLTHRRNLEYDHR